MAPQEQIAACNNCQNGLDIAGDEAPVVGGPVVKCCAEVPCTIEAVIL